MQEERPEQRKLSSAAALSLVVGNMIGTGIFVTSGFLARDLGNPWFVLGAWTVGGLLALSGASIYGELGAMLPRAGGEYVYLSRAFHEAVGFLSGWVSIWVGFAAPVAASATAFALYLQTLWPSLRVEPSASALIALLSLLHSRNVVRGARAQVVLTALKVLLLAGFAAGALSSTQGSWTSFAEPGPLPHASKFAASIVLVSFSYSGWNAAAYVAGEIRDPARTLPRALIGGTAIVVFLYLLLNVALFYAAPPRLLGEAPETVLEFAARALFGARAGKVVAVAVALGLVSSVSAMTLTGPRVAAAIADDGLLLRAFTRRTADGAPWVSIVAQSALAIILVFTATFEALLNYVGFTLSAFALLTVISAVVLRIREPQLPRPYRAMAWPLTPVLFAGLSIWIVCASVRETPGAAAAGLMTLVAGCLVYLVYGSFSRRSTS